MKKVLGLLAIAAFASCNVSVDEDDHRDSASRFDSFVQKADTTMERWGDSAKEKYKDLRDDVKERMDDDRDTGRRN